MLFIIVKNIKEKDLINITFHVIFFGGNMREVIHILLLFLIE